MKHSILCVDDEVDNVDALERLFRRKYNVLKATSGAEALQLLAQSQVTVIISDQRMPQLSGVELLAESIRTHPDAIRILLTGYTDINSVIAAVNSGQIYRYVTKPWDPIDLTTAVDRAVERYEIGAELREKNKALQEALAELKTLDEAKNQFMVLVNHELKTPLTSMLSFSDLLAETKLDVDQQRMLARIKSSALRLQEMVNDALEFVAAETAQTRLELKSLPARSVFGPASLSEPIQSQAQGRGIDFRFAIENQNLVCDEKIIRNVFRRLMHNAAKFAEAASEVFVTGRSTSGGLYELTIENHGPLLDEKQIQKLLQPFTLNENALNHSMGTGLGLGLCRAMLKLHGSALNFHSRDARITVGFSLPIDRPDR